MSGIAGSNLNIRGSGVVAQLGTDGQVLTSSGVGVTAAFEDIAAGISWQSIVTGSSMTAVAGNGYWINTTSNACAITLPSSASAGDQIVFADYARTWGTNSITIDSNDLNYQGEANWTIEYDTDGTALSLVYMDATNGWIPTLDKTVTDVPVAPVFNDSGIFAYGDSGSIVSMSNLVNSSGVVASDVTGVGTARKILAACEYGGDKGIFAYGDTGSVSSLSNLVSNSGVIATDTSGVGTARSGLAAATYGGDKGIFAYGYTSGYVSLSNLVNTSGVISADVTGVGTARGETLAACEYSGEKDKAIFAYGYVSGYVSTSNLVSNTGVVATDTTGVGTARYEIAACGYGNDKGIFAFGQNDSGRVSMSNLVSSSGVVATDTTGVGTARGELSACEFGEDKGIFAYGSTGSVTAVSNLVSNSGVVATDVSGVGTARRKQAACSFA